MIDTNKKYKTRNGQRVIIHEIKLHNSAGGKVTYPVKGSIIVKEKPFKTKYQIWSLDGRVDVVWGESEEDLIEDI